MITMTKEEISKIRDFMGYEDYKYRSTDSCCAFIKIDDYIEFGYNTSDFFVWYEASETIGAFINKSIQGIYVVYSQDLEDCEMYDMYTFLSLDEALSRFDILTNEVDEI